MDQQLNFLKGSVYLCIHGNPNQNPSKFFVCFTVIDELILKPVWKCKKLKMNKTTLKRKREDLHYLISKFIIRLQQTRQCGVNVKLRV